MGHVPSLSRYRTRFNLFISKINLKTTKKRAPGDRRPFF